MQRVFWLLLILLIGCANGEPTPIPTATATGTATPTPQIGLQFATRAPPTAEIIQITPTPLPTATPTPTATPIVYSVQSGDTIWEHRFFERHRARRSACAQPKCAS